MTVVAIAALAAAAPDLFIVALFGQLTLVGLALVLLTLPMPAFEEQRPKVRLLVDGAIVGLSMWALVNRFLLQAHGVTPSTPETVRSVLAVAIAMFALGLVLTTAGRVERPYRVPCALVAGGIAFAAAVAAIAALPTPLPRSVVVVGSLSGAVLAIAGLALATIRLGQTEPVGADEEEDLTQRISRLLPSLMIVLVMVMAAALALRGWTLSTADNNLTGVIFIVLLVVQQFVAYRERTYLVARLKSRGALFQSLVTGSADLITLQSASGVIEYASPAVYRLLGASESDLRGGTLLPYVHPDDVSLVVDAQSSARSKNKPIECVYRLRCARPDSDEPAWRWVSTSYNNMLADPDVRGVVANTRDIHDEHELGRQLAYEAYHDALTGLGNLAFARRVFAEQSYGADRLPTTVILLDLDGFKTINDTFGHAFGDDLLIAVARRLRSNVEDDDAVARIGGDEFVMIFEAERDARKAARAILHDLSRPLLVQGTNVIVSASMGIAKSVDAKDSEELLRNADLAMYEAKSDGGNTYVAYDERMFERIASRMQIQEGLRTALETDGLEIYIQPILDLRTRRIVGGEALLRWTDDELGRVPPDVFIPVAESSGLIAQVDRWVLNAVCHLIRQWTSLGVSVPQMSVNLSRRQVTDGLDELIGRVLTESTVRADQLCVEVTESAVVPDPAAAIRVLRAVRRLGVTVALDDFGTGQSSLSQLADLPIDRVKIDKSFVMPAANRNTVELLQSIVGLCHSLQLPIVAEGVEDERAASQLVTLGAQYGQGYHFYRPMPASEFLDLIAGDVPVPRQPSLREWRSSEKLAADDLDVVSDE